MLTDTDAPSVVSVAPEVRLATLKSALGERNKELDCIYGIAGLAARQGISLEGFAQGVVELLPPAWQYPQAACARAVIDGREFRSSNYGRIQSRQGAHVVADGHFVGRLEVCYPESLPERDEEPFLPDERKLLEAVAHQVGRFVERVRAEHQLRENQEKMRSVLETCSDWILSVDRSCRIVFANRAPRGMSSAKTIGTDICDHLPSSFHRAGRDAIARVLRSGQPMSMEFVVDPQGWGSERWHGFRVGPVKRDGLVVAAIIIISDISDRKRAEAQLERSASEVGWASDEVKELAGLVSNDLVAPLVNLKGHAAQLCSAFDAIARAMPEALPHLEERQRQKVTFALEQGVPEALDFISSSVTRMDRLVGSVQTLARAGNGGRRPRPEGVRGPTKAA